MEEETKKPKDLTEEQDVTFTLDSLKKVFQKFGGLYGIRMMAVLFNQMEEVQF